MVEHYDDQSTEAVVVAALLRQFERLRDPASDPGAELRIKVAALLHQHMKRLGPNGSNLEEAQQALRDAITRDPAQWPHDPDQLVRLLGEVFSDPNALPPLSAAAQLVWLGFETQRPNEAIDAALFRQFPALTPGEIAAAYREAEVFMKRDAREKHVTAAAFKAWTHIQITRGRPEHELTFGLVEERDGHRYTNFNNLSRVADVELRQATIAAAWKAQEEHK
jgi:hypothetical protein